MNSYLEIWTSEEKTTLRQGLKKWIFLRQNMLWNKLDNSFTPQYYLINETFLIIKSLVRANNLIAKINTRSVNFSFILKPKHSWPSGGAKENCFKKKIDPFRINFRNFLIDFRNSLEASELSPARYSIFEKFLVSLSSKEKFHQFGN